MIPIEAKDLISGLLQQEPTDRLSIPEILSHAWMAEENGAGSGDERHSFGPAECQAEKSAPPDINAINVGNLFYPKHDSVTGAKLTYTDYCYIANDFYTQHLDEEALKVLEGFGYPRKAVVEGLMSGELNHAVASYNLLVLP